MPTFDPNTNPSASPAASASTTIALDLATSLRAEQPLLALRSVLVARLASGGSRELLLDEVGAGVVILRAQGRDVDADVFTDGLDLLVGWAAPHMVL